MASLKRRLALLKNMGLTRASEIGSAPVPGAEPAPGASVPGLHECPYPESPYDDECLSSSPELPAEWNRVGEHCHVSSRLSSFSIGGDFPSVVDERMFCRCADRPAAEASRDMIPLEDMSFFDLETTGLSGGTGTIAFLAGIGHFEAGSFVVRQIFIDDFPGEADLLGQTLESLGRRPVLVSYNGKAFDLPLLRTRCVMNGVHVPSFRHVDLLYPARRLWKSKMESCALSALEQTVLGLEREDDVPGALIPGIWLEYARSAPASERRAESLPKIKRILAHNTQDIVSLARLLCRMVTLCEGVSCEGTAGSPAGNPAIRSASGNTDWFGLARMLLAGGRDEPALELLKQVGIEGDQRALVFLARYYRRCGQYSGYRDAVTLMDGSTVESCIEKAKFLEHVEKDYAAALASTEKAMAILEGRLVDTAFDAASTKTLANKRQRVEKRRARLASRLETKIDPRQT